MDAKIRITAIADQAIKVIRDLKKEAEGLSDASSTSVPLDSLSAGAAAASKQVKETTANVEALAAAQTGAADAAKVQAAETAALGVRTAKEQSDRLKQTVKEQKAASDDVLKSQRAAANQARQLGPQLTDIFVGLSTGQSPFTVLLQQGGQLKDVFGGVGNAAKALGSIFTPLRVLIGSVATVLGTIAYQAYQGAQQSDALRKSIALTGNIAGTSAGQINDQSRAIAAQQQVSIGSVRETLQALVSSGEFTATSLGSAGTAAVALSKLTGQSAAETIKQFDGMSAGVAAWALKSNQAYNFLTNEQYQYIQSLEAQGRTQEAMKVTLDALSSTLEQRSIPAVGSFERAWNKVKEVTGNVLETLRSIGRDDGPEGRVKSLTDRLAELEAQRAKLSGKKDRTSQLQLANSDPEVVRLKAQIDAESAVALAVSRGAKREAAQLEVTQQENLKSGKAYQDALSAITEAGSQRQLASQLAALDLRQAAADRANAAGLTSAVQYNAELNKIDQGRLVAQAAALQRQIQIAASRKAEKPQDVLVNQAQVEGLQAQLLAVQGQISAAAIKGRSIVEADALESARDKATQWADVWQKAYDQVRELAQQNGATNASLIADPVARAAAEATNKTADLRRQIDELKRDLVLRISLTTDPGQIAALKEQLDGLTRQGGAAVDEQTRLAQFASYQTQISEIQQAIQLKEADIDAAVARGKTTTVDAEQAKFDARAQSIGQLDTILARMNAIAQTPAERNQVEATRQAVVGLKDTTTDLEKTARASGISSISDALTAIETGSKSAKDGLLDMVTSFAKAMLDVLNKRLAEQLVNQFADSIGNSSSGFLGFLGSLFGGGGSAGGSVSSAGSGLGAQYGHTGAIIGGRGGWNAQVPAAAFAFAPRYHSGGILGLKSNEVPFVGEVGEEVLTRDDPRHSANGGGASVGDVNISVAVSGSQGDAKQNRDFGEGLAGQIKAVVVDYVTDQRRPGGVFARS